MDYIINAKGECIMSIATVTRIATKSVYNDILIFLNRNNENTGKVYKKDIGDYFVFMAGKQLEQLTKEDIEYLQVGSDKEKVMSKHVDEYKNHLRKTGLKDTSIIRKIISVRSLYKFLSANGYDVNYTAFETHGLSSNVDSYDVLTKEQVDRLAEFALEEEAYPEELHVFIYVASQTSLRVDALLSVTWDNIEFDEHSGFHVIKAIDKRDQQRVCPVDAWLFEKMVKLRELLEVGDSGKLFPNLKQDYINKKIKKIAYEKMKVSKKKKIVTHSLRKSAISHEFQTTGNLDLARRQSGHRSVETLMNSYVVHTVDYNQLAGIRMFKQLDESVVDLLDKKEIIELLKKTNPSAYHQLLLEIHKIIE